MSTAPAPARLPVVATILVAVAAGVLAAVATRDVAVTTGAVTDPRLGWLLPIIIEGGAVTAGLLAWRRTAAGVSATWERLALLVLVVLAVAVNASHASGDSWLGVVLAACPPLVLIASVELLLRNRETVGLRPARKRASAQTKPAATPSKRPAPLPVERPAAAPSKPAPAQVSAQTRAVSVSTERPRAVSVAPSAPTEQASTWQSLSPAERRALAERAVIDDPSITGAAFAERYGCGASTARRMLAEARSNVVAA